VFSESERNLLSNAGHPYAKEVLPGGTGRAYAGHGEFRYGTNPKAFTVPDGTALSIWTKPGIGLPDRLGRLIEMGDYDTLSTLFSKDSRVQERLTGAATHLPGAGQVTGLPGDVRIPNYTLSAPTKLRIHKNSITVEDSRTLSELIQPDSGHLEWAACTEFPEMGR
jgi:filamentous hemagglutinin